MSNKIEFLGVLLTGGFVSQFASDLIEKVIITTIAMVIGTTVAFYWRRYLDNKTKNK